MMRTTIALLVLAAAAGGCGGDGPATGGRPPESGSVSPSGSASGAAAPVTLDGTVDARGATDIAGQGSAPDLALRAGDSYFEPTYVRVAPGATVTVAFDNTGRRPHTFTVAGGPDITVRPGETADATVTVPADRALRFFCRFHQAGGMQGAFYSTAGQTVAAAGGGDGDY